MSAHLQRLPDALPDDDNDAAEEGTAAAWAAECVINGDASTITDMVGRVHKNGVEIDPDMDRHLTGYVALARSRIDAKAEVYGEVAVAPGIMIAGTSDLQSWSSPQDFHIDDLKYGYKIIEPTTLQVAAYALLAYARGVRAERWHLGIYQPRAVHHAGIYRTATFTLAQIEAQVSALWSAAQQIATGDRTARPGPQCANCLGAAKCEALTHSVYSTWQPLQSRTYTDPTPQQLADELAMLRRMEELIDARLAAVEAETQQRLNAGKFVPGWAMMPRKGQRKFKYPATIIEALTGVDPSTKGVCTPAELERRGADPAVVARLSETPTVGYKLAPYDNRAIGALFGEGKKK
jgi:hypothetical protein